MNQKKIIYVTPALPVGGAEKFMISLSSALTAHTAGQTIVSLSNINPLEREIAPGVRFLALPRKNKFDLGPLRALKQLIREQNPDYIFCINFFSYFVVRLATMSGSVKARKIISYHSTNHLTRKEHWLHKFYSRLLGKDDLVITVSGKQTDYTSKTYNIPEKQFKVIYNGIDTAYWQVSNDLQAKNELKSRQGIPLGAKVIILTAAFRPEKNHLGAIRALRLLHQRQQDKAFLLFVGDGVMKQQIVDKADELGLTHYVKMAGIQKDVRPFYQASDLFTLCSTNVETFSIAALEAMSTGLPCVLTDIGGARDMVKDGVNGFVCETTDESIAAAWARALSTPFSKEAIHQYTADNFSIGKMIEEYKQVLDIK